jgi:hypothetical protein
MARQNGQATWISPVSNAALGDDASSTSTRRAFVATERMTVTEVGAIVTDSAHVPTTTFAFKVNKRIGGDSTSDMVIPVFKAAFSAEGGIGGDSSNNNFDNANQITNGIITNTAGQATVGFGAAHLPVLRAYTEVSLDKGDMLVFQVTTGGGASSVCAFYATAYYDGKGLVESADVDSN